MENIPSAVVIVDADGKFVYLNKRAIELYGFNYVGFDLVSHAAKVKALMPDGTPYPLENMPVYCSLKFAKEVRNEEMSIQKTDGKRLPVLVSSAPIFDAKGKVIAAIAIFEDIAEHKQAEKAIIDNERKYRNLFANLMDGFALSKMIFDENNKPVDFVYLEINDAFEKLTGLKRENIVGKKVSEAIPGTREANPEIFDIYGRVALTGNPERFEVYFKPLKIWLDIAVSSPSKGYFVAVFENITESKNTISALKESEERYRTLVNTSSDAIIVHEKDGHFVFANPATLKLLGMQNFEDLKNKSIFDFIPIIDQKKIQELVASIQEGTKTTPEEEQVVRLDGAHVFVEAIGVPIYYKGDWAVLAILRDITQRKLMQQKLEEYTKNLEKLVEERTKKIYESEQNYRELYESFGEPFIATDWELNIIHWNQAAERVIKVAAKDALGKKMYEVFPEMASVDVTPYYETLSQGKPVRFTMHTISRETEHEAIFEISTYPSTQGIIYIIQDKTEEEQTKRLSAIGQTASMVGHDIRNPLHAIIGDVYLLQSDLSSMPEGEAKTSVKESLDSIENNIFYINKIVSDLQDYTRPLKPNVEQVNIKDLINSTIAKVKVTKTIETAVIADQGFVLDIDPDYLRRILTNLAFNSVQAMPNGGKLTIKAQKMAKKAIVSVEDTGVGIPQEVKPNLFKPLFTTKSKGQGLGLAVVKRLVESLNGNITFESEEGKGTKFIIELPIKK